MHHYLFLEDVEEYVVACLVCDQSKSAHSLPAGLLCPLIVPGQPWSYITIDFITGISLSVGNNSILTIIDSSPRLCTLSPSTTPLSFRNGSAPQEPCFFGSTIRHCLRVWTSIHLSSLGCHKTAVCRKNRTQMQTSQR